MKTLSVKICLMALLCFVLTAATVFSDADSEYREGWRAWISRDYITASRVFLRLAASGDSDAQYNLYAMYYKGHDVRLNQTEALHWLREAAANKHPLALYQLGFIYRNGWRGVTQDYTKARELWEESLKHTISREGRQEKKEDTEERKADIRFHLGQLYENGLGVGRDYTRAYNLYSMAANSGLAPAQYNLGCMFANGLGVEQNHEKAVRWFYEAADQGYAEAQYNLGFMFANGLGVTQNHETAARWFHKAADQRFARAMWALGVMYATSDGIGQNLRLAYMWFSLAASYFTDAEKDLRNSAIKDQDTVAQRMTPDEIAEAERLVNEWSPK